MPGDNPSHPPPAMTDGSSSSSAGTSAPSAPKRRRLELSSLQFSSPGAAFDHSPDLSEGRAARRAASRSASASGSASASRDVTPSQHPHRRKPIDGGIDNSSSSDSPLSREIGRHPARSRKPSFKMRPEELNQGRHGGQSQAAPSTPHPHHTPSATSQLSPRRKILLRRPKPQSITPASSSAPTTLQSPALAAVQSQLDEVHSSHDDMVRELFHLTKFVTYVGFDPEVAKQDRSHVFEHFRVQHGLDLESKVGQSSSRGSRTTRRIVSQRMDDLALRKTSIAQQADQVVLPSKMAAVKRDVKGKARARDEESNTLPLPAAPSPPPVRRPYKKRQLSHSTASTAISPPDADFGLPESQDRESFNDFLKRRRAMAVRSLPSQPDPLLPMHPSHLPLAPRQHSSLKDFYSSLRLLPGADPTSTDIELSSFELDRLELRELQTYLRLDQARVNGKMPDRPGISSSSTHSLRPPREPWREPQTTTPYASLLQAIPSASSSLRADSRLRRSNARKVSRMIQQHFTSLSSSSARDEKALQRHLRALAKWTAKEVNKQWKLAVSVVRAQKVKEEKRLREEKGREQLSKILEQSMGYLGKRQEELERGMDIDESEGSQSDFDHDDADSESDVYSLEDDGSIRSDDEGNTSAAEELSVEPDSGQDDAEEAAADATIVELAASDINSQPGSPSPSHSHSSLVDTSHLSSLMNVNGGSTRINGNGRQRSNGMLLSNGHHGHNDDVDGDGTDSDKADGSDDGGQEQILTKLLIPGRINGSGPNGYHANLNGTRFHNGEHASRSSASSGQRDHQDARPDEDFGNHTCSDTDDSDEREGDFSTFSVDRDHEDAQLDQELLHGNNEMEGSDDSDEDAGLLADANLSIEELKRRYGYDVAGDDDLKSDDDEEHQQSRAESASAVSSPAVNGNGNHHGYLSDDEQSQSSIASIRHLARRDKDQDEDDGNDKSDPPIAPRLHQPFLLRGNLRPYQQTGFEWLASLYANNANGILADEMGLGKTIQTISVLAHLACDKGVWGPHLVVAPTSVMLNWEVEFKKFLPGFKILSYYGSQRERKEKRKGWNSEHTFNVCITSYQLVLADQHIFRRKPWVYMILDEAHHIKNFRSQRWQTLLGFNSQRRLLLTGTPLQNNLMDLWSLMYFLMPNGLADVPGAGAFANMKDFQDWFSNPLDKAVESGSSSVMDEETRKMVGKLHTILRPFLLRRLKSEVEKELPRKYEHVIRCRLSKRQRFLYNDFMSRAKTRESLASGNYMSIINCLMQLRKVCNHPDLFEVRPIHTAFAMSESVVGAFEAEDLLVRKRFLENREEERWNAFEGQVARSLNITSRENSTPMATVLTRRLDATKLLPYARAPSPPKPTTFDMYTVEGHRRSLEQRRHIEDVSNWKHRGYVNHLRTGQQPIYGKTFLEQVRRATQRERHKLLPNDVDSKLGSSWRDCSAVHSLVKSYSQRSEELGDVVDRFAFVTPNAMALDMPQWAVGEVYHGETGPSTKARIQEELFRAGQDIELTAPVQRAATKLQIAFPDAALLQYDCGKLQELEVLMRRLKEGSHRILIFTQMTKVLDILEAFLNLHGYRYLRLDGSTRVDRRQALTEKFNRDTRIDAFILSTRSGGLGINLTGADTVLFYDLDWNSAIESQCMDRAHRIGQLRDVHIYRFVSIATVEENMLRKADQKRLLDSMVIQGGEFTTEHLQKGGWRDMLDEGGASLGGVRVGEVSDGIVEEERALEQVEDEEDRVAAKEAKEEMKAVGIEDQTEFDGKGVEGEQQQQHDDGADPPEADAAAAATAPADEEEEEVEDGTVDDYMLKFVNLDWSFFNGGGFKV